MFSCVPSLASSGCQQLAFDNLMVHYKFINADHSFLPEVLNCDFIGTGNLVHMVAKHGRE